MGTAGFSINTAKNIAGSYLDHSNVLHGFMRAANGKIVDFKAPGGGTGAAQGTVSFSINTAGILREPTWTRVMCITALCGSRDTVQSADPDGRRPDQLWGRDRGNVGGAVVSGEVPLRLSERLPFDYARIVPRGTAPKRCPTTSAWKIRFQRLICCGSLKST
jgi:hypothetical protein